MSSPRIEIGEVSYNAAEQAFEAVVKYHRGAGPSAVAARFPAPLSTGFDAACDGLIRNAARQMRRGAPLRMVPRKRRAPGAERTATPTAWLDRLIGRAA